MQQHYYRILGVAKDAGPSEIKKAYRGLARKFHPDHNGGHPMSEQRFRMVAEAYSVLADDSQRSEYDRYGTVALRRSNRPGMAGGVERFVANLEGILNARMSRIPKRGKDLRIVAELPLVQACHGGSLTVEVERLEKCAGCDGSRAAAGTPTERCHVCDGRGQLKTGTGLLAVHEPCVFCQGFGVVALSPCTECDGLGEADQRVPLTIETPAGVESGRRLVLRGRGEQGQSGGASGDLVIELRVADHALLTRDGHDLQCTVPITLKQALLGSTVEVPLLEGGRVSIRVKPGAATGQLLRLRGRGAPTAAGGAGDLMIRLEVETPRVDTKAYRQLLEELERVSSHPEQRRYLEALDQLD